MGYPSYPVPRHEMQKLLCVDAFVFFIAFLKLFQTRGYFKAFLRSGIQNQISSIENGSQVGFPWGARVRLKDKILFLPQYWEDILGQGCAFPFSLKKKNFAEIIIPFSGYIICTYWKGNIVLRSHDIQIYHWFFIKMVKATEFENIILVVIKQCWQPFTSGLF